MSSKILLSSFVNYLNSIWNLGTDMVLLCPKQLTHVCSYSNHFFGGLCVDKENVLMIFSKNDQTYRLLYCVKTQQMYMNDSLLIEGQYDQEFTLSLAWYFDALRRSKLLVIEGVFASLKHKQYDLSCLTFIKKNISNNDFGGLMTKHICVTDKYSLDPLLSVYPELNRYNFFDARNKVAELLNGFDQKQNMEVVYSSHQKDLAVA